MGFIFRLIKWSILAPFKLLKFIISDVLIFGIIGGILSFLKAIMKVFIKPISLAAIAGGILVFVLADEEKRNKVKALIGM